MLGVSGFNSYTPLPSQWIEIYDLELLGAETHDTKPLKSSRAKTMKPDDEEYENANTPT